MTTIQGHVVDPQGGPVTEAAVYVISAPVSMPDIAQLTGAQGEFALAAAVPGHYTIGARSETWGVAQTNVEVKDEETLTVKVQFTAVKG